MYTSRGNWVNTNTHLHTHTYGSAAVYTMKAALAHQLTVHVKMAESAPTSSRVRSSGACRSDLLVEEPGIVALALTRFLGSSLAIIPSQQR